MGKYLFQNLRIVCLDEYHSIYQRLQAEAFSPIGILILGAALGQIDLPDDARIGLFKEFLRFLFLKFVGIYYKPHG